MINNSDSDEPTERALFVYDNVIEDYDESVPPTSGSEYIRRVREEAKGCPKVVVANIDTKTLNEHQTVKVTEPSGLLPVPGAFKATMIWQRMQVAHFSALRQKLIQWKALVKKQELKVAKVELPLANDAESWCRLCFGRLKVKTAEQQQTSSSIPPAEGSDGTPPLLSIVAQMNQQQVESVLEYHINWLEATGFSSNQGRWLYGLLANLQKPLTPETCSWLRRLSRLCSNIRASLESCEDPRLQELNLIICLVARYFEQRDLADT